LVVELADDGAGIDPALSDAIFAPGFTTQTDATRLAGRGIGLDIVRSAIEEIDGLISVRSELGKEATFMLDVPISLSAAGRLPRRAAAVPAGAAQRLTAGA
jgi:chemotaxis protein histidine kinase CheA